MDVSSIYHLAFMGGGGGGEIKTFNNIFYIATCILFLCRDNLWHRNSPWICQAGLLLRVRFVWDWDLTLSAMAGGGHAQWCTAHCFHSHSAGQRLQPQSPCGSWHPYQTQIGKQHNHTDTQIMDNIYLYNGILKGTPSEEASGSHWLEWIQKWLIAVF